MLPPAYMRSSYSTERGKKSIPSRGSRLMVAAAKIRDSPTRTVTAPPACAASPPVVNRKGFPSTTA